MRVSIFEEHSSVLPEWWERGERGRTLVCLDAHLDLQHVSRERLARLEQCTTAEAVKRLEKPHHLMPDRGFSYSLEDFLYPAHRLGLIGRLIWVAPAHVETGYSRRAFEQLQQMDGVCFDELAGFRKAAGGWIEGRLLGLEVAICSYQQLEMLPLPDDGLIDIDTDYFVSVPGDEAWVDPRQVFEALSRLPWKPDRVSLSRSVSSGFVPLRYRFLADYLAALWKGHEGEVAHCQRLFALERRLRAGEVEAVVRGCQRELESRPGCAATHHLLSLAERDPERAERHRSQAAKLCSAYRPDPLRSACEFPARQLSVEPSKLRALEKQLSEAQLDPEEQALARVALGLVYCSLGQPLRAFARYQQAARRLGGHPELALEIAKLLLRSQQADRALELLEAALEDDKTRATAHTFLAQLHAGRGSLEQALRHLETAHRLTPAWGQILSMLAAVHQRLGNSQQSRSLLEEVRRQQSETAALAERLGAGSPP